MYGPLRLRRDAAVPFLNYFFCTVVATPGAFGIVLPQAIAGVLGARVALTVAARPPGGRGGARPPRRAAPARRR
ncbi:hypothetical protein AB8O38_22275, partial [Saccharomonospora xinjiangensis]|uniref:hypothetical protein n=1 Tax=Saccharomonospora xinjiangensis TaxID=75294 RepID=UPI00350ECC25